MIAHNVGQHLGIEDGDVEAVALISDLGDEIAAWKRTEISMSSPLAL